MAAVQDAAGRPEVGPLLKSSMKTHTLEESLRSTEHPPQGMKNNIGMSVRNLFRHGAAAHAGGGGDDSGKENSEGGEGRRKTEASSDAADVDPSRSAAVPPRSLKRGLEHSARSLRNMGGSRRSHSNLYQKSKRGLGGSGQSIRNLFASKKGSAAGGGASSKRFARVPAPISEPSINFGSVLIREYKTEVDVNPGVSKGPAVSLRWEYTECPNVDVDAYESARPPPKKLKELKLSPEERLARLKSSGISDTDIRGAMKQTNQARQKRLRTIEMMKNSAFHERVEGAKRKLQKVLHLKKSKEKEEEALWQNAETYFNY